MKHFALLPALALIAACATPQEQCISTASNEVRSMQKLIHTTQGNIARGYAIHRHTESYQVPDICHDKNKKPYRCFDTEYRTIETPVTINIAEERRKLAGLKNRLPAATRKMRAGVANCQAQFPQ